MVKFLLLLTVIFNITFIILTILSLFLRTSVNDVINVAQSLTALSALRITFLSLLLSTSLTTLLGIPFAYLLANRDSKIYKMIDTLLIIPLVMPPTVTGLALLMAFGRRGILSSFLIRFNLDIPFSFTALIFVQVFVMLPLFVQSLKSGFEAIDDNVKKAAMVFGSGEKELLFDIYLPLSIRPLLIGLIIAVLRAAGEFGATIMFAGNLEGRTQTLTTAIYTLAQQNLEQAIALAVLLLLIFLIPLLILQLVVKK